MGSEAMTPEDALEFARRRESQERYDIFMSKRGAEDDEKLMLKSYEAHIAPLDAGKRDLLHELTVSVFWPHRPFDLDLFMALGHGYLATDSIERPLGSAMGFKMEDDFAMIGMMTTTPRVQTQGVGRRLLRWVMRDCVGRDLRLSATRSGYRLYENAGFIPVNRIWQHQGVVRKFDAPAPLPGYVLRPMEDADLDALLALDRYAFGAGRREIITTLMMHSEGIVLEHAGEIKAFAMLRPFGKGMVIGPVIAEEDAQAMAVTAPLIQTCQGRFTRLDTPQQNENFQAFLAAAGMGMFDTVTEMRIGPHRRSDDGPVLYGLASHSLG